MVGTVLGPGQTRGEVAGTEPEARPGPPSRLLHEQEQGREEEARHALWMQHNRLVRGNPVQVFEGSEFKLKKNGKDE